METDKYNILYVDDELSSLSSFINLFRKKFSIIPANSAKEGLEILASQHINLIITDQRMPEMTGIEFLKKVKKQWPDLKYILLTAFAEIGVIKEAINDVGIYWYINKPFDPDQMEQMIIKAIEDDRSEMLLKESEKRFSDVANNALDWIWEVDPKGKYTYVSPIVEMVLGYKPKEMLQKHFYDLFYPDDRKEQLKKLAFNIFASKENFRELVNLNVHKNGQVIWLSTSGVPILDETGELIGYRGADRDITKSREAEKKLKDSEEKYRNVIENIPDAVWTTDNKGNTVFISPNIKKIYGYNPKEIYEHGEELWFERIHPDDVEHVQQAFGSLFDIPDFQYDVEYRIRNKKGEWLWLHDRSMATYLKDGIPYADGILTNITERKKADEKLQESEEKFRGVFNSMMDVFSRSDLEGNCIMVSPSVFKLIGYKPEEIIGKKLSDFYAQPDQRNRLVEKLQKSNKVESFEIEIKKKDGGIIIASVNAKNYYDDDGNPLGIEGLFRDISDVKRAEIELTRSEKRFRATFEQAAVGIAHVAPDGRFLRINQKFCEIVGYNQDEMLISDFQKITHPDDLEKDLEHVRSMLNGQANTYSIDKRCIRKNGNVIWVTLTVNLLRKETFEPDYFISVVEDITDKKNVELKIKEYQQRLKDLANDLTISEEKARKQVAVDLHDNVGQLLSSSRMQLATVLALEEDPEISIRLKSISQALLKTIETTREAIFNLSPPQLNEIGLYAALHDWTKEQVEKKYDISTSITGEHVVFDMEENTRILIFRSIKELMMNVLKHAGAKQLKVDLKRKGRMLEITVEDDGDGFNYNADFVEIRSNRYGLFSIHERLSDLEGSLTIDSVIDKGTIARLSVPLKNKA